jgi:2-polyprenyl-3-methyl-5-hydroxy-6-metoxy-1,4-benzoquinol methylase
MRKRSNAPEIIDLGPGHYTQEEYEHFLTQLDRIGRWLGGDAATLRAIGRRNPQSVLDVGCGGGGFSNRLALRNPGMKVVGIDTAQDAIAYAQKHASAPNVAFYHRIHAELREPDKSYDVVMASLVCHHMEDGELCAFLQKAATVARDAVIINDLHRSAFAYGAYAMIAPVIFRNRLITQDGLLSIRKGFTRADWHTLLQRAGFAPNRYRITWKPFFRWIVEISC